MTNNYFNNKIRKLPHGVMFHHFHNDGEKPYAQGSITSNDFIKIIEYIGVENILPASIWLSKAINNELSEKDICITFDDALKSQIDVAYPILKELNITAFWFVYSSVFMGHLERLEIYKYFYNVYFSNFDSFLNVFKNCLIESEYSKLFNKKILGFPKSNYLKEECLYSDNEREFRFIRDKILGSEKFQFIMDKILLRYEIDINKISENLWMDNIDLIELALNNHLIGLHSFSHPTDIKSLDIIQQEDEYARNKKHIQNVTRQEPLSVSHPCGSYNDLTLELLLKMGINIGFRSNFNKLNHTNLEFPRVDHMHVLSEINAQL